MGSIDVHHVTIGGEHLVVLSLPLPRSPRSLTNAERAVAGRVARGQSNAEVARARGSSTRTVANQLARIFRKLGVSSRTELAALLRSRR